MSFAGKLTRLEQQFVQMKTNQFYKLGEAKVFRLKSYKMASSYFNNFWRASFSYRFVPLDGNDSFMYAVLRVYNKDGIEASVSSVRRTLLASGSLSNYSIENDTLILSCNRFDLTSYKSEPDISDKSLLPFSVQLEIVSFSDGALQVSQL